jgi:hypothetical protein
MANIFADSVVRHNQEEDKPFYHDALGMLFIIRSHTGEWERFMVTVCCDACHARGGEDDRVAIIEPVYREELYAMVTVPGCAPRCPRCQQFKGVEHV